MMGEQLPRVGAWGGNVWGEGRQLRGAGFLFRVTIMFQSGLRLWLHNSVTIIKATDLGGLSGMWVLPQYSC